MPAPCVLAVGGASLRGDLDDRARALWPAVSVALLAGKERPLSSPVCLADYECLARKITEPVRFAIVGGLFEILRQA